MRLETSFRLGDHEVAPRLLDPEQPRDPPEGGRVQQGYEETTYHGILDAAGYPKAGALPARNQQEPKAPPETAEGAAPDKAEAPAPRGPYSPATGLPE